MLSTIWRFKNQVSVFIFCVAIEVMATIALMKDTEQQDCNPAVQFSMYFTESSSSGSFFIEAH